MVEIIGNYPEMERTETGLWSFDRAFINTFGDLGFPIGHGTELFGLEYIGKTTFGLSLGKIIAKKRNENMTLIDFEGFDAKHLKSILSDFPGKLFLSDKKTDEDRLGDLIMNLRKPENNCGVGILDSIGAISPISEEESDIGEGFGTQRAKEMAQFTRKAQKLFRFAKTPKTILAINHYYPKVGGTKYQYNTPGGNVKDFLLSVRILLKRKEKFPDQSYVIEGTVKKNRWGLRDKVFYVFMLSGKGIHQGMSWMFDGFMNGTIQRGRSVKIGDVSMGRPGDILKHAHAGDDDFFIPFRDAVYSGNVVSTDDEIEDENENEAEE